MTNTRQDFPRSILTTAYTPYKVTNSEVVLIGLLLRYAVAHVVIVVVNDDDAAPNLHKLPPSL